MTVRLFLFEPGKIHAKLDFVLQQRYGKKQRKRNHLQLVNKGALLARRAIRISVDGGHQSYNANPDNFASSRRHQPRLRLCVVKPDPENNRMRFEPCAYPRLVALFVTLTHPCLLERRKEVFYQVSGSF